MKLKKPSFTELVLENKKMLLQDKQAMEEIEKRIELKALKLMDSKE